MTNTTATKTLNHAERQAFHRDLWIRSFGTTAEARRTGEAVLRLLGARRRMVDLLHERRCDVDRYLRYADEVAAMDLPSALRFEAVTGENETSLRNHAESCTASADRLTYRLRQNREGLRKWTLRVRREEV